jgi:CRP/FNR family transcriptional regulator
VTTRKQQRHLRGDELGALLSLDSYVVPKEIPVIEVVARAGEVLINYGESCNYFLLVVEGLVRVERISTTGDEIVLYHLGPSQSCELATACMLAGHTYPAIATAEENSRVLLIPKQEILLIFQSSETFRRNVFRDFDDVASHLLALLEQVAFMSIDQRLAKYLLQQHNLNNPIRTTHESIAHELGTAREVVSRALKRFQHEKWIKRSRGAIWIDNIEAIKQLALHYPS